ncbi:FUSC family protein (plasmid) [Coraliomargarita sp. W4R53]
MSRTTGVSTTVLRTVEPLTDGGRLILAGKTALAASLAWFLVPFIPFADDQYSYYAPLGVLVSMYPTVAGSARAGMQALLGLALGIGLGLIGIFAFFLGVPAVVALAAVVGLGVFFGGIRGLGEGSSWVATAALFVLLLSGNEPDDFSISYLGNVAFGVIVGVVVNLTIFPPLYLRRASNRLSALRDAAGEVLVKLADYVRERALDSEALDHTLANLETLTLEVRSEVSEAAESSRVNPRGRRHRTEADENQQRQRALDRVIFYTHDLASVIVELDKIDDVSLSADVRASFADAIQACSQLVSAPVNADDSRELLDAANTALTAYLDTLHRATDGEAAYATDALTPAVSLRRVITASLPFVRADEDPTDDAQASAIV